LGDELRNLDSDFLQKVSPILREAGFSDEKEALKEQALMLLMGKVSRYQAECAFFEEKYGMSFEEFASRVQVTGEENFEEDDDFLDWRFARESLADLRHRLQELKHA
jgi:hypothetical protein